VKIAIFSQEMGEIARSTHNIEPWFKSKSVYVDVFGDTKLKNSAHAQVSDK
jgi:hypothetical protein